MTPVTPAHAIALRSLVAGLLDDAREYERRGAIAACAESIACAVRILETPRAQAVLSLDLGVELDSLDQDVLSLYAISRRLCIRAGIVPPVVHRGLC